MKTFYRVCNPQSEQGLWYDYQGRFTGLIHDKFSFCANSKLEMPFDDELVGWLSAVKNLDDLWAWFTMEDIFQLQKHGWFIHEYEVRDHKFYDKFNHYVIHQDSSKPVRRIDLGVYVCLDCKLETLDYISPCPPFKSCQCCSPHHPKFHHHKDI
jgi:hypothetical protein